jgi:hypothetical protein
MSTRELFSPQRVTGGVSPFGPPHAAVPTYTLRPPPRGHSVADVTATVIVGTLTLIAAVASFFSAINFAMPTESCPPICGDVDLLIQAYLVVWAGIGAAWIVSSIAITITAFRHRPMWPWATASLFLIAVTYLIGSQLAHDFANPF